MRSPEALTVVMLRVCRCPLSSVGLAPWSSNQCRSLLGSRDRDRSPPRGGGDGERGTGIAQRWNEKGFGFIKPDDGGDDLFCHFSGIQDGRCLIQGSKVSFRRVFDERKGKDRAEEVTGGAPEDPGMVLGISMH